MTDGSFGNNEAIALHLLSPTTLRKHSIRVYREPADPADIELLQTIIVDEFGDGIEPITPDETSLPANLTVISGNQMAIAIAQNRQLGGPTTHEVKLALENDLPRSLTKERHIDIGRVLVSLDRTKRSQGVIYLPLGHDRHFRNDHTRVTDFVNKRLPVSHTWPDYRARIPIARLMDKRLAESITSYRFEDQIHLALSGIHTYRRKS